MADSTSSTPAGLTPATTAASSVVNANAPAVKLPLAARKNLRDKWDTKRAEREAKLSEVMGTPWTIPVDYATVWAHLGCADNDYPKGSPGGLVDEHIRSFLSHLESFKSKHGQEGIEQLNSLAKAHSVIIAHTTDPAVKQNGTDIDLATGIFRIVFSEGGLGVNTSDACKDIAGTLNKASLEASKNASGGEEDALGFEAKSDIRKNWDAKLPELQKGYQEMLAAPVFTLTPNFEENAAVLLAYEKKHRKPGVGAGYDQCELRDDWRNRIGEFTEQYFSDGLRRMKDSKFGEDDMLQEGFKDGVEKNEIALKVVDELPAGISYNTAVIEGGVLVIKVKPSTWAVNVPDALEKVIDLL